MPTLNRYIAKHYLVNCVLLFAVLFAFVVAVDVFVNLGRFVSLSTDQLEERGVADPSAVEVVVRTVANIADLWWPRLLQLSGFVTGLVLVGAMGFTCSQLVRNREFVALLASGVPLHRVARPFLVVAVAITSLQALNQETLVPAVANLLVRGTEEAGSRTAGSFPVRLAPDGEGRFFSAARYDDRDATMRGVVIYVRDEGGIVSRVVTAETAVYRRGRGWELGGVVEALVGDPGAGGAAGVGSVLEDGPGGAAVIRTALDPERLKVRYLSGLAQNLSWRQLGDIIDSAGVDEDERRRLDLVRWGRVGALVSNVLTLVAAMPFFLLRAPVPMLKPGLKALPVALGGLVAAAAAPTVGLPGLPVWVSAFVPALVIAPLAVAMFGTIKT